MMDSEKHNELFSKACALLDEQILLEHGDPGDVAKIPEIDTVKIEEGIECLKQVVAMNATNWSAYWLMGKAYQSLRQYQQEYESFKKASAELRQQQPDDTVAIANVLRELAYSCMKLDKFTEASYYGGLAIEFDPQDFTLISNQACVFMCVGNLDAAEKYAQRALYYLPQDIVAKNVLLLIPKLRNGEVPQPVKYKDLENISV
jgi:tetratricopeptide (TPR) repeat protein